jgi:hypothetical protein
MRNEIVAFKVEKPLGLRQQMHKAYKIGDVIDGVAMKEFR